MIGVARDGNRLAATFSSDYVEALAEVRHYDQVVVNHGTDPLADLYFDLKELSSNRGEVDHVALIEGLPQGIVTNADGAFQLFRIGYAVSSRNIHAAVFDGLRHARGL